MSLMVSGVPGAYSRNPDQIEFGDDMGISVFGGMQQAGGLKQALKEHREHHKKQADELLQLTDGLDHNEPRAAYVHLGFPKMLYKPDPGEKGEKVVLTAAEMAVAVENGWREEPYPRVQIAVLDPATEKKALVDQNNQMAAQIVMQNESMLKMQEQQKEMAAMMAELMSKKKTKE